MRSSRLWLPVAASRLARPLRADQGYAPATSCRLSACGTFVAGCVRTIVDCDDDDAIAAWGEAHRDFLRRLLPFDHGVPGGRWLTIMMNRINRALFSACFTAWVRDCWPDRPDLIAIDGKTSRGSHDKARRAACRFTSSRPSPPRAAACSRRRPSPRRPTNWPPSRCCSTGSRPMTVSRKQRVHSLRSASAAFRRAAARRRTRSHRHS